MQERESLLVSGIISKASRSTCQHVLRHVKLISVGGIDCLYIGIYICWLVESHSYRKLFIRDQRIYYIYVRFYTLYLQTNLKDGGVYCC